MHIYETGTAADIALAAGVAKTILSWINGATRRCRMLELQIGFNSQLTTDQAVLLEIVRYTTDGTGTLITPVALDPANPAAIGTSKHSYTVEPTTPTIVVPGQRITPQQGGTLIWQLPMTREIYAAISTVLGVRCTSPNALTGVRASMTIEE